MLELLRLAAPFKGWMALAVLLGVFTIGSSIGLMATSAFIIASAAFHPSVADLAVPIVGVRFFGIARGVFRYLERLVSHHVTFSLLARLRVWFYESIEPLAPARLIRAGRHSGDLLARIVGDIEILQNFYIRLLAPPLVALGIAVGMGVYLFGFSPELAAVVLFFMLLAGVVVPVIVMRVAREPSHRLVQVRAQLNTALLDGIQGMADLLACGRAAAHGERVNALSDEFIRLQARMAALAGMHSALGMLMAHAAVWFVLLIAIPLVTARRLDGVYLGVLALAVLASFEGVLALPLAFQYLEGSLESARRLFEIVDGSNPVPSHRRALEDRVLSVPVQPAVEDKRMGLSLRVENLSFRYAPGEPLALKRISFDLAPGCSLAIVGPSGAGKSTLVNLLLRFWDVTDGRVLVGGRDLTLDAPETARQRFGVVSQSTYLFNMTMRQNLLLARPNATEEQIVRATQQAQVHDFICSLPEGYETLIGEQGLKLSGGERQRLAIARALLKDAPILLFDEPTANLDPATAHALRLAMEPLMQTRTTLWITHRLSGLETMDEILVLEQGRVVERGRHVDLLQAKGKYNRMWNLQQALFMQHIY